MERISRLGRQPELVQCGDRRFLFSGPRRGPIPMHFWRPCGEVAWLCGTDPGPISQVSVRPTTT